MRPARSVERIYRILDQEVVDGAVNGIANETGNAGGLLSYVQSGRVQRYALILFASVGAARPAARDLQLNLVSNKAAFVFLVWEGQR